MNSRYKRLFKINKKNNTYGSNKNTDYFSKMIETTENEITSLHKKSQIFPLPNNSSPYNTVDNISFKNYNMSILEYSSYSTITSSSDGTSTIFNTKTGTYNKYKINNRFDSDSDSKNSKYNNMR